MEEKGELSVKELVELAEVSKQTIYKSLNSLIEQKKIIRLGAPKTIYKLYRKNDTNPENIPNLDREKGILSKIRGIISSIPLQILSFSKN